MRCTRHYSQITILVSTKFVMKEYYDETNYG